MSLLSEPNLPINCMWLISYNGYEHFEGGSELEVIEWFLAHEGLHPDGADTRRILHSDGSTVWG